MGLMAVQDWRNSLAVAVEIIAGFGGFALLVLSIGVAFSLYERSIRR